MKFIGMDAHSRQCTFAVLGKNGQILRRATVKTQERELLSFVRSIKGRKKLSFEEGIVSQWLYVLLKDEVEELVVCQPPKKNGAKTDKIDAEEIADLLRVGRLKLVFHADCDLMYLRILVSGYGDVIQELTRTKNRYKALYRNVAIATKVTGFYTSTDMIPLLDTDVRRYVASTLFEQIKFLEVQRSGYLERFNANVSTYKSIELLTTIPGIGPVRANQIVGVMVTPHRFPNKYHLFSYAMLTKHNLISDGKLYGKTRANGQVVLKAVFKSAVLSATRSENTFRRKRDAMKAAGKDDRAVRNAVAKMLAATVFGVWKSGKKYDDKKQEVSRRRNNSCHSGN